MSVRPLSFQPNFSPASHEALLIPSYALAAPHLTCRLLPNSFHYNDVYNDLAIQWVRPADVALVGSSEKGWEEPVAEIDGIGDEVL